MLSLLILKENLKFLFFCSWCGERHLANDPTGLVEIRFTSVQKVGNEVTEQPKKYRCPKCGHCFKTIKLQTEELKQEIKREEIPEGDEYLKLFEREVLKSIRNKNESKPK